MSRHRIIQERMDQAAAEYLDDAGQGLVAFVVVVTGWCAPNTQGVGMLDVSLEAGGIDRGGVAWALRQVAESLDGE